MVTPAIDELCRRGGVIGVLSMCAGGGMGVTSDGVGVQMSNTVASVAELRICGSGFATLNFSPTTLRTSG